LRAVRLPQAKPHINLHSICYFVVWVTNNFNKKKQQMSRFIFVFVVGFCLFVLIVEP